MNGTPNADPLASLLTLEGVPSGFAAARDGVDALLRDRGLRRTPSGLTAESLLRGAAASGELEGSTSGLETVRVDGGDEIARAAVRVSTELLGLAPLMTSRPLQAFARIHALAGRGALPDEQLGRPRDAESAGRLRALADTLVTQTEAPAMMVAAIVHADLATAAPFASHNGIVARACERLMLVARGVDEKSLLVPEAGHLRLRAEYESNLRAYANASGSTGVHAWLLYAIEAQTVAAELSPLRD
ncbi:MAG: oxidoreductase [Nocardioides sp.]|nr:oxidoreductase [Nocardioides sp.]